MFQVCIKLLEYLFPLSVDVFAVPNPEVHPFMVHRAFPVSVAFLLISSGLHFIS
jgi:hypothetical protein